MLPFPVNMTDDAEYSRWQHRAVRDLAWTLLSPPLLHAAPGMPATCWPNQSWCRQVYTDYLPRLTALDRNPAPLLDALAQRRSHRLGSHFEALLQFWLSDPANERYRLMAAALPLREQGITLGELDFLVQDIASGDFQHWEVAVKFYLGTAAGDSHDHWVGPGGRDRLDIKVNRLLQHQLVMAEHPAARAPLQALGIAQCTPVCLLKGRLFYPQEALDIPANNGRADWSPRHANPGHLHGWWLEPSAFIEHFSPCALRWLPLSRQHWLSPVHIRDLADSSPAVTIGEPKTPKALLQEWPAAFDNRPLAVVGLTPAGTEATRGFVCPEAWKE